MSGEESLDQFSACWEGLEDSRNGNAGLHDFHELLMIALCTVLCGGQGAVDMALFAEAKEPFLRSFLNLANGVPSHDTFSRLFRNLDPDQFADQRRGSRKANTVAALISRQAKGQREVSLPGSTVAQQQHVLLAREELASSQIEHQRFVG